MSMTECEKAPSLWPGGPKYRLAGTMLLLGLLSGCGHRDPVDTPVNWWHQLEGGAIAEQRPPPPGVDDPYPRVGTTPATAPVLLSPQLRAAMTEHLIEQRNLSARLNATEPLPPPVAQTAGKTAGKTGTGPAQAAGAAASGPGAATAPAAAPNPAQSSATLDAAEAPPPPPVQVQVPVPPQAPVQAADRKARKTQDGTAPADSGPELAMPAIAPDPAGVATASGPIPAIPNAPPAPPGLPGIAMPPPPSYVAPTHPDYVLTPVKGESLQFPPGSDALSPGQDGTLSGLAIKRGATGIIYVHGFGDSGSDTPADQAQALTLASLRARSVADALRLHGVPAGAIRLRADAFGRGATAGLID